MTDAPQLNPAKHFIIFIPFLHLSIIFWMCVLKFSLTSNHTPKYLILSTCLRCCPYSLRSIVGFVLFLEKHINCVFSIDRWKPHSYDHFSTLSIADCILTFRLSIFLPLTHNAPSSAYNALPILWSILLKMSLIIILKSIGLHTLPCGVPFSIGYILENSIPTLTSMVLLFKKSLIQLKILPPIPILFNLIKSPSFHNMSYAFSMSKNITKTASLLTWAFLISFSRQIIESIVVRPLRNPLWWEHSSFFQLHILVL